LDRREEILRYQEELRELYPRLLRRISSKLGRAFAAVYGLPLLGPALLAAFARISSYLIVRLNVMGVNELRGGDAADMALAWMRMTAMLCAWSEVEEADEDRVILSWSGCLLGYDHPSQAGLCRAVMEIDRRTVRRLGGDMRMISTIPEGHGCCRFLFTSRRCR